MLPLLYSCRVLLQAPNLWGNVRLACFSSRTCTCSGNQTYPISTLFLTIIHTNDMLRDAKEANYTMIPR